MQPSEFFPARKYIASVDLKHDTDSDGNTFNEVGVTMLDGNRRGLWDWWSLRLGMGGERRRMGGFMRPRSGSGQAACGGLRLSVDAGSFGGCRTQAGYLRFFKQDGKLFVLATSDLGSGASVAPVKDMGDGRMRWAFEGPTLLLTEVLVDGRNLVGSSTVVDKDNKTYRYDWSAEQVDKDSPDPHLGQVQGAGFDALLDLGSFTEAVYFEEGPYPLPLAYLSLKELLELK